MKKKDFQKNYKAKSWKTTRKESPSVFILIEVPPQGGQSRKGVRKNRVNRGKKAPLAQQEGVRKEGGGEKGQTQAEKRKWNIVSVKDPLRST